MRNWFRRQPKTQSPHEIAYARIVAKARSQALYRELLVEDTISGRYEMLVLHTVLGMRALMLHGEPGREQARLLVEVLFESLDADYRQQGIGYNRVPKKMADAAAGFYGRANSYEQALVAADVAELAEALRRNVYGNDLPASVVASQKLAGYAAAAASGLASRPADELLAGELKFPAVEEFLS